MHIKHTFRQSPVRSGLFVIITSLTLLLAGQIVYINTMSANAASGFNSETDPNVLPMLDGFKTLPSSTIQENDQKVKSINNNATADEVADAYKTNKYPSTLASDKRISISVAFGPLQTYLEDAVADGDLDEVVDLVNQKSHLLDLDSKWESSDTAKDEYDFQRPYCTSRTSLGITQYPNPSGGDTVYASSGCTLAFPSGHTRYAYGEGVALATMVPELAPQIMARTAEVANNRIILGMHYPLDVIGGRAIGTRMIAARWHDDTWRAKLESARTQLRTALEARCGDTIPNCIAAGSGQAYMSTSQALDYSTDKLTYGFTRVGTAGLQFQAPDYAYELLSATLPDKTPAELNNILATTAIDSGYPLDTTGQSIDSNNIGWTRVDLGRALYVASGEAGSSEPGQSDTTAPTVSLTSPANNSTISDEIKLGATANDASGVAKVEFSIDGILVGTDSTSPYEITFDTESLTNGSHTIVATAYDESGNHATDTISVTVANSSEPSQDTGKTFTLSGSTTTTFSVEGACSDKVKDQKLADAPLVLKNKNILIGAAFTVECSNGGQNSDISIELGRLYDADLLQVFKQSQSDTEDITDDVNISSALVNGKAVTVVAYSITDGGFGDEDKTANSEIVDPIFVALSSSQGAGGTTDTDDSSGTSSSLGAPNTGLELLRSVGAGRIILLLGLMIALAGIVVYPQIREKLTK